MLTRGAGGFAFSQEKATIACKRCRHPDRYSGPAVLSRDHHFAVLRARDGRALRRSVVGCRFEGVEVCGHLLEPALELAVLGRQVRNFLAEYFLLRQDQLELGRVGRGSGTHLVQIVCVMRIIATPLVAEVSESQRHARKHAHTHARPFVACSHAA